jgi:hypothetical protein
LNAPAQLNQVAVATQQLVETESDFTRLLAQPRTFSPQDLMVEDNLSRLERMAERMASGRATVPEYLRGNVGDCLAICIQSMLWNMDPFAVAQKTHIVSGKLGYEAQLVNAVLQNSGAIRGLPRYEYRGDSQSLECRVGCLPRGESEILWGEWLSISSITTKNSSLWKTNPKQQLGYLQVKNWARAFAPGAILGVYTVDELEDNQPPVLRISTSSSSSAPAAAASAAPVADQAAAPTWPDDAFGKQLPRWSKAVAEGLKTVDEIFAMARSKGALTDAQSKQISALKPAPQPAQGPVDDSFVAAMNAAEAGDAGAFSGDDDADS